VRFQPNVERSENGHKNANALQGNADQNPERPKSRTKPNNKGAE
jgi:hypothetical protein